MLAKGRVVMSLQGIHGLAIQLLNALPDLAMAFIVICEIELFSPMAEIRREDEQCGRIVEIWCKYLAVFISHFFIDWSCENRNYLDSPAQSLHNKRQMHFYAVLIFVIVDVQHMKTFLQFQFVNYLNVDVQRPHWCVVFIQVGQSASGEVFMVRRTKDEHSLYIVRTSYILV